MSPTARTLAALRASGWVADVVERWIGGGGFKVRKACFGLGDILAYLPDTAGVLLIQACAATDLRRRVAKLCGVDEAVSWLRPGGERRLEGWSWRIGGAVGVRKLWSATVVPLSAQDGRVVALEPLRLTPEELARQRRGTA